MSIVFKALVVVLESGEKAEYLPAELRDRRPKETSSILNRGIFYWLNRLMVRGARHLLLPADLYELQQKMTADQLMISFVAHWQQADKTSKHAALVTTAKTLKWRVLAVVFPRIILLALTICQPILIQELLTYLSVPNDTEMKNVGYGLIGAYALVYIGTAVATGF